MAIFKKRGKWWIGYRVNGRRRREPVGSSYTLAKEVLSKRLADAAERRHFPARVANAALFERVADKYWDLHGKHLASRSWGQMLDEIRAAFKGRRIGELSAGDIQRHYNVVAGRASAATANRHLTLLRSIFNKAMAWEDFYGDNPCSRVKRLHEAPHRLRYLSREEMAALLEVSHPRLRPIIVCALTTGMRRGEIFGLRWENVSLERSTIYLLRTKSGKPREVPIGNRLRTELEALRPTPNGQVFDLPLIMLRRYFNRALKDAAILGFRFHDLRHTFASHFIMKTNDLPTLQNLLGHSTPAMTQRYAHLSRAHLASAMAAFESAIPQPLPVPASLCVPQVAPQVAPPLAAEQARC